MHSKKLNDSGLTKKRFIILSYKSSAEGDPDEGGSKKPSVRSHKARDGPLVQLTRSGGPERG